MQLTFAERIVTDLHLIMVGFLVTGAMLAAGYDLKSRRIPNWLSFSILSSGLLLHFADAGMKGILFSLSGLAAGAGLLLLPYLLGGMGAGDLKLLAALGALVGAKGILAVFIISSLFGGAFAIAALVMRDRVELSSNGMLRMFLATQPSKRSPVASFIKSGAMIPYGVAISCGAITLAGLAL